MVISMLLAILGVVVVVMYFFGRSNIYGSAVGLFAGVVAAVLGLYLFFNPRILESLGPIIVGLIILVTGLVDLSEAFRIARQKSGGQIAALVIAVLEIVFGVIFILHPGFLNAVIMKLMAICLIADGVADIWVMFQIGKGERVVKQAVKTVRDAVNGAVVDGKTEETSDASDGSEESAGDSGDGADSGSGYSELSGTEAKSGSGYTTIPHGRSERRDAAKPDEKTDAAVKRDTDGKDAEGKTAEKRESTIPSANDIATELPPEDGPTSQV